MRRCLGPLASTAAAKRPSLTGGEEEEAFLNLCSYPAAEAILWLPFRGPLGAWRAERGLPAAPGGGHFQLLREQLRIPVVYTFSRELLGGEGGQLGGPGGKRWGLAGVVLRRLRAPSTRPHTVVGAP